MLLSTPDLKSGIPTYDRRGYYVLKLTPKCEALTLSDEHNVGGRQETTQIKSGQIPIKDRAYAYTDYCKLTFEHIT